MPLPEIRERHSIPSYEFTGRAPLPDICLNSPLLYTDCSKVPKKGTNENVGARIGIGLPAQVYFLYLSVGDLESVRRNKTFPSGTRLPTGIA